METNEILLSLKDALIKGEEDQLRVNEKLLFSEKENLGGHNNG